MSNSPLDSKKNEMYRRAYPRLLSLFIALSVLALTLLIFLSVILLSAPKADNYAALSTGQINPIYSYSEPVLTDNYIRSWAKQAAHAMLNLSFSSYHSDLKKAVVYFTPAAQALLSNALEKNGYIKGLRDSHLIMRSFVNGAVVIVWQGKQAGRFIWKVQLPMMVSYEGANGQVRRTRIVRMTIIRVPTADNPRAILINSIQIG